MTALKPELTKDELKNFSLKWVSLFFVKWK